MLAGIQMDEGVATFGEVSRHRRGHRRLAVGRLPRSHQRAGRDGDATWRRAPILRVPADQVRAGGSAILGHHRWHHRTGRVRGGGGTARSRRGDGWDPMHGLSFLGTVSHRRESWRGMAEFVPGVGVQEESEAREASVLGGRSGSRRYREADDEDDLVISNSTGDARWRIHRGAVDSDSGIGIDASNITYRGPIDVMLHITVDCR
mmetsp:Transcript_23959/g.66983  ORF Transcript_23959/g.66983 Transcript_23959/m.66983 type:complete len:205 (-) Transcript_23959:128-742(-)